MSNMSSTSKTYEKSSKKFEDAYNKYAGDAGLKKANTFAKGEAESQAKMQSTMAGSRAGAQAQEQARTAGMSKAAAADTAASNAANATRDTYGSVYNSTYGTGLTTATANNANAVNARAGNLNTNQQEGQNRYNRAWGNVGGVGSMVTGLLTSDERLKHFKEVSSSINNGKNTDIVKELSIGKGKKRDGQGSKKEPTNFDLLKVKYTTVTKKESR